MNPRPVLAPGKYLLLPFDIGNPPHFSSVSYMRKAVKIVAADKTKSGKPVRKIGFPTQEKPRYVTNFLQSRRGAAY
jgi:hypothetical protein